MKLQEVFYLSQIADKLLALFITLTFFGGANCENRF